MSALRCICLSVRTSSPVTRDHGVLNPQSVLSIASSRMSALFVHQILSAFYHKEEILFAQCLSPEVNLFSDTHVCTSQKYGG